MTGRRVTDGRRISRVVARTATSFRRRGEKKKEEGHAVDALASSAEEGRGQLRKASGSRNQAVIRRSPNGATHHPVRGDTPV